MIVLRPIRVRINTHCCSLVGIIMLMFKTLLLLAAVFLTDCLLVTGELYEDGPCTTSKGPGICQSLLKCQSVYEELKSSKRPEVVCGYSRDSIPIVCCPGKYSTSIDSTTSRPIWDFNSQTTKSNWNIARPTTTRRTITSGISLPGARPARRMCAKYAKSVYTLDYGPVLIAGDRTGVNTSLCAIKDKKLIVGGTKADPKEFPHSTAIGFESGSTIKWSCGGTLISETFVLTAAHCLTSEWGNAKWIRVGDLNLQKTNDNAKPQDRRIIERIRHPNYKRPSKYHDMALLRLESAVTFDAYVRPACLDVKGNHATVGNKAVATGWGRTEWEGDASDDLLKVVLPIVGQAYCQYHYSGSPGLRDGILDESQLCAYENQKDTCQGDSGGPLVVYSTDEECMYDLIGVTSFGAFCGSSPGVYSRITYYLSWIESIVWPNLQ